MMKNGDCVHKGREVRASNETGDEGKGTEKNDRTFRTLHSGSGDSDERALNLLWIAADHLREEGGSCEIARNTHCGGVVLATTKKSKEHFLE
jgi:hypothetical protein